MTAPKPKLDNKMPQKLKDKWLAALRSGKYKQGTGKLRDDSGGYCCLGVLEHCISGKVEKHAGKNDYLNDYLTYPSLNWLSKHNIQFVNSVNRLHYNPTVGFKSGSKYELSIMNDSGDHDFNKIANIIEKYVQGV